MTKKILSILMVCALAVCMCIPAFAAEPESANQPVDFNMHQDEVQTPEPRYLKNYTADLTTNYQDECQATYTAFRSADLRLTNDSTNANALTFKIVNEAGGFVYEGACNPGDHVVVHVEGSVTGNTYKIFVRTNWSNENGCKFSISK